MLRYVNTSLAFFAVIQSVPPLSRRRRGGEQVHVDIGLVERVAAASFIPPRWSKTKEWCGILENHSRQHQQQQHSSEFWCRQVCSAVDSSLPDQAFFVPYLWPDWSTFYVFGCKVVYANSKTRAIFVAFKWTTEKSLNRVWRLRPSCECLDLGENS